MKPFFLLIALCFAPYLTTAEVIVYNTYQDYIADKGDHYQEFVKYKGNKIVVANEGTSESIKCSTIWGFKYSNALFRIYPEQNKPACLISEGKICYYENGYAHLGLLKDGHYDVFYVSGSQCYFSLSINSQMMAATGPPTAGNKKKMRQMIQEKPQVENLFNCIRKSFEPDITGPCVKAFEAR